MSKARDDKKQGKKSFFRNGIAATGFVTAVILVLGICYVLKIDMATVAIGLVIVIGLAVGVPLFIFSMRENTDVKDENETCQPIMKKYFKTHNTKALVDEYWAWTEGEHSSYSRVHFAGDVIAELHDAKKYEDALRILDSLEGMEMKARERYDYENFRDQVRPQLLEGIEKEEKRAEERARNKNLRKK